MLLFRLSGRSQITVSDIPECADVVEDKALIFKKSNVDDLKEKLQDACDHPEKVNHYQKQAAKISLGCNCCRNLEIVSGRNVNAGIDD